MIRNLLLLVVGFSLASRAFAAEPEPAATAIATPVPTATETDLMEPATPEPAATVTPEPQPTVTVPVDIPTPVPETPTPAPTPRPAGLGSPVLFRGECTPGGGPAGCRIVAAGIVTGDALAPIPCDEKTESDTRKKIAERYFHEGTPLDLYVRGASTGTFVVADTDEPNRGCGNRARGKKVSVTGKVVTFVAFDPEDPVKLGPLRFPSGVQPDARSVVVAALKTAPFEAAAQDIGVHEVRRLRDGDVSVIVAEVTTALARSVIIAEGKGADPAAWSRVWASDPAQTVVLVDAFDLGADGKTEIFVERIHRGEASEWILLRRDDSGWKPVSPPTN